MELKGSKTERNLLTAFAGESQARNRYNYFASQAKTDGYEQIPAIFAEFCGQAEGAVAREYCNLHGLWKA